MAAARPSTAAFLIAAGLAQPLWGLQPPQNQRCFDRYYAQEKKDALTVAAKAAVIGQAEKHDSDSSDGLVEQENAPLPEPPEIARVQRGLVSHFIGEFTNDGLESWSAIDLDRRTPGCSTARSMAARRPISANP